MLPPVTADLVVGVAVLDQPADDVVEVLRRVLEAVDVVDRLVLGRAVRLRSPRFAANILCSPTWSPKSVSGPKRDVLDADQVDAVA